MTERHHPDTGQPITDQQWNALARDATARLSQCIEELNRALKIAAKFGLPVNLITHDVDETVRVRDLSPLPDKVVGRIDQTLRGPKYQQVYLEPITKG